MLTQQARRVNDCGEVRDFDLHHLLSVVPGLSRRPYRISLLVQSDVEELVLQQASKVAGQLIDVEVTICPVTICGL